MNHLLISFILLFSIHAYSDYSVIHDRSVYSVKFTEPLYSAPLDKALLGSSEYLKFTPLKKSKYYRSFSHADLSAPPKFEFLPKPKKIKLPIPEGCGYHPQEFLRSGQKIAHLKKQTSAIYLQVPAGFKKSDPEKSFVGFYKKLIMSEYNDAGRAEDCPTTYVALSNDKTDMAVVNCADDLNDMALVFIKDKNGQWANKPKIEMTLSGNCP